LRVWLDMIEAWLRDRMDKKQTLDMLRAMVEPSPADPERITKVVFTGTAELLHGAAARINQPDQPDVDEEETRPGWDPDTLLEQALAAERR
jgi:hypothetical protein